MLLDSSYISNYSCTWLLNTERRCGGDLGGTLRPIPFHTIPRSLGIHRYHDYKNSYTHDVCSAEVPQAQAIGLKTK